MSYKKLLSSVTSFAGISDKFAAHLARLNITRAIDFLLHLPHRVREVKINPSCGNIIDGDSLLLKVQLLEIPEKPLYRSRAKFKILCQYNQIIIELVFFNFYPGFAVTKLNSISEFYVYGNVQRKFGVTSISHPKFIFSAHPGVERLIPVYHLTYGIVNEQMHKWACSALDLLKNCDDVLDANLKEFVRGVSFYEAIHNIHRPQNHLSILPNSKFVERLAFDELLAHQLAINILRNNALKNQGIAFTNDGKLVHQIIETMPFQLTANQNKVIAEIKSDQESAKQMMRLVQGDVGSGKTAVAMAAAAHAIASGDYQVAIMAPLDILASQHYEFFRNILEPLGIKVALFTGKIKGKERIKVLSEIASGESRIIIGTHALFQEKAEFNKLGLIIIDEQHRFGVNQRMSLLAKGYNSDMLMLTATPIPRTLTQIIYADLDLSIITQKPPGRIPIKTSVTSASHLEQVIESLGRVINRGEKIYWICPLIEEGEGETDEFRATSIEERHKVLAKKFPGVTGYLHGKLSTNEKNAILENFNQGELKLLVATTVIEVGIDIKDATVIIIENAEGYGLSQLHQLRGRVGRSHLESFCILLYSRRCSKDAVTRLAVLRETDDGFKIADEDLKLRGGGDLAGTKQSGLPEFKICNLYFHSHLAAAANEQAKKILAQVDYKYELLDERYKTLIQIYNHEDGEFNDNLPKKV